MITIADTLACFAALILLTAAVHKLLHMERVSVSAARLAHLRPSTGPVLARLAAAIEVVAGATLLMPSLRNIGAILALAVWSSYALLLWNAAAHGRSFDCGCSLFSRNDRSTISPAFPTLLALVAVVIMTLPTGAGMSIEAPFAALALFSLSFASGELTQITRSKARA
jgi:uncharacterized membrane protein YphA (DoxX/SURF4 family)